MLIDMLWTIFVIYHMYYITCSYLKNEGNIIFIWAPIFVPINTGMIAYRLLFDDWLYLKENDDDLVFYIPSNII